MGVVLVGLVAAGVPARAASDEFVVAAGPDAPPGCEVRLDGGGLPTLPARDADQLLHSLPGATVGHRWGRGGAPNLTFAGFDVGFGEDLAVVLDGIPVNLPSSALGPGSADLSFVPRGLLTDVVLCPDGVAPDRPADGRAGAVLLGVGMTRTGVFAGLQTGTDGSGSAQVRWRPQGWDRRTFVAAELEGGEGVAGYRSFRHLRVSGGVAGRAGPIEAGAMVFLHDGGWDVPTPLRPEDIADDTVRGIGRYRAWDGDARARSARVVGRLVRAWDGGGLRLDTWFGAHDGAQRVNLTGFLFDPVRGDGQARAETALDVGLRARMTGGWSLLGDTTTVEGGLDLRTTQLNQRWTPVDLELAPAGDTVRRIVQHATVAAWTRATLRVAGRAWVMAGARVEETDLRARDAGIDVQDAARSVSWAVLPTARVGARIGLDGRFHAGWARVARALDGRDELPAGLVRPLVADVVRVDADAQLGPRLRLGLDGYAVFAPEDVIRDVWRDRFLFAASTRRVGGWGSLAVTLRPGLAVGIEGSGVDARRLDTGARLPWVPIATGALAVRATSQPVGPVDLTVGARALVVGPRPMPDGRLGQVSPGLDLSASVTWKRWTFSTGLWDVGPVRPDAEPWLTSAWAPGDADAGDLRHVVTAPAGVWTLGVSAWF
ncbi:MAG: hypothetical protein RLZZ383_1384 [Pseudomonadota bacterium]